MFTEQFLQQGQPSFLTMTQNKKYTVRRSTVHTRANLCTHPRRAFYGAIFTFTTVSHFTFLNVSHDSLDLLTL